MGSHFGNRGLIDLALGLHFPVESPCPLFCGKAGPPPREIGFEGTEPGEGLERTVPELLENSVGTGNGLHGKESRLFRAPLHALFEGLIRAENNGLRSMNPEDGSGLSGGGDVPGPDEPLEIILSSHGGKGGNPITEYFGSNGIGRSLLRRGNGGVIRCKEEVEFDVRRKGFKRFGNFWIGMPHAV